nr:uncharacterized protein LOC117452930 [Pseudochaenichthys georgianus]
MNKSNASHLPTNISAKDRAKQFPDVLHESGGKLFCTPCNCVLEYKRKSTVKTHFDSLKHSKRLSAAADKTAKQLSFTEASTSKTVSRVARNEICEAWVATCTAVNIPLSKSDHPAMRKFLNDKVINGGAIPGFHQLQEKYLGAVYEKEKEELKTLLAGKPVAVIFDETPDVEGRCVLNILLAPLKKDHSGRILAYLADTVFLEQCNHSTVSVAVVKCLQEYRIQNEDVIVFDTDNAAYMKKAFKSALQALYPNSLHITCMAHIMNLIGNAFRKPFVQLNSFMMSFSQMFFNAGSRKRRYLCFMTNKLPTKKVTMPPNPCATRWNSWFFAVQYHREYFGLYKEFIEMETQVCGRSVPQSVERLHDMLQDPNLPQSLNVQINIMADKCKHILNLLDIFESRRPVTTKIFNYLEDLQVVFAGNKEMQYEVCDEYFKEFDLPRRTKTEILRTVGEAYVNAEEKLTKYMSDGQPAIEFLQEVRVFDPRHITFLDDSVESYKAIPGFTDVPRHEFDSYFTALGPAALRAALSGVVDLDVFWDGVQERLPVLSSLAHRYKDAVSNSADAERSNSIYKLVLSSRRRSTTNQNLKALVFLCHNQRILSGAFEREEREKGKVIEWEDMEEWEDMDIEGEGMEDRPSRKNICEAWVATCTAVNIPLSKSDHPAMRKFLNDKVINGGAIPGFHQLQEKYLGAVYEKEKEELKTLLAGKPVAVIFDETPDVEGRCVLNILLAPLKKDHSGRILAYLADTVFLEQCNHSTVSVAVVKCLQEYRIQNEDVIVFDTDNAAYMKKAFKSALQALYPNSLHITCMAHIMNLIGNAFRKPFVQLNSFMMSFSQMFFNAGSRKRRYLCFMTNKLPTKKVTMPPNPCATRWNSWFFAVQYHREYFGLYKEFIEMETQVCGRSVPQSVERLHDMLQDPNLPQSLNVQINIMADKCKHILNLLDIFESRRPVTTKIFNYLEDLQVVFAGNKEMQYEVCDEYFKEFDLPRRTKTEILRTVGEAYVNAEEKLTKYMSDGQPAIEFLQEVRVFDPRHITFLDDSVESYKAIPGFTDVPRHEFDSYFTALGPAALRAALSGVVDLDVFWDGVQERLPVLSSLAHRYKDAVSNSADAERSNSIYKLVLSSRRRSTTNQNLKALVFLCHNQRILSGAFEREEREKGKVIEWEDMED